MLIFDASVLHLASYLFDRAVVKRRLTTRKTALLAQTQVSSLEIKVLHKRHCLPSMQSEHTPDILSLRILGMIVFVGFA